MNLVCLVPEEVDMGALAMFKAEHEAARLIMLKAAWGLLNLWSGARLLKTATKPATHVLCSGNTAGHGGEAR